VVVEPPPTERPRLPVAGHGERNLELARDALEVHGATTGEGEVTSGGAVVEVEAGDVGLTVVGTDVGLGVEFDDGNHRIAIHDG
jgi:hypothetical protein